MSAYGRAKIHAAVCCAETVKLQKELEVMLAERKDELDNITMIAIQRMKIEKSAEKADAALLEIRAADFIQRFSSMFPNPTLMLVI
jgi:hypothetical protein